MGFTVLGTIVPGVGLIAAGRKVVGSVVLAVFVLTLAAIGVAAAVDREALISVGVDPTSLRRLAAAVKARWSCEQVHQQLKQELGLGDFEGRSWTGLHRHALMTCIAFAYLQHRRLKAAGRGKKGGARRTAATAVAA